MVTPILMKLTYLKLSSFSRSAVTIEFLLGCSLWYASCSKLRGIVTQKPDRATLINSILRNNRWLLFLTFTFEQSLNSNKISCICRPVATSCWIRSLLIVNTVWKPICMCDLLKRFHIDFQPLVEFPSTTYLQSVEVSLREDWFRQLPPYFWDARLTGLQVVETGKTNTYTIVFKPWGVY